MSLAAVNGAPNIDAQARALLKALSENLQVDPALRQLFSQTISSKASQIPSSISLKDFGVVPYLAIDTSGESGKIGYPGSAGSIGAKGLDGTNGANGSSARDIHLRLARRDGHIEVNWDSGKAILKLSEAAYISIRALGGRGGNGGIGGRGGNGFKGQNGRDADRFSPGENGRHGSVGGAGGNGGNSGSGGNGGHLTISVSPEDADLLMLIKEPDLSGGTAGQVGVGGPGGAGGQGGEGGRSYSWTETTTVSNWVPRPGGGSQLVQSVITTSKFNPGGFQGSCGSTGSHGMTGRCGVAGGNGSIEIRIGDKSYPCRYKLAMGISKVIELSKGNSEQFCESRE